MKHLSAALLALAATTFPLESAAAGGWEQIVHANPDPSVAWMLALGFLGLVVLRRTRHGPMN